MKLTMKNLALALGLAIVAPGLVALPRTARAEIGTIDNVPAATLLLPYFEVDLANPSGITTLFSINNASASAGLAHVTLWTDQAIPTAQFDVYLTGYDVQTINLRDIFNGNLPRTADDGEDPTDTISRQGNLSQDINFPPGNPPQDPQVLGPCDSAYVNPAFDAAFRAHLAAAHRGQFSAVLNGCAGVNRGDNLARGFVTIDSVSICNLSYPTDVGYFSGIADNRNILWGDYFFVDSGQNFAQGDMLVHIEACSNPAVGNGAGNCPFTAGDQTFYGSIVSTTAVDQREPLGTTYMSRYINGGSFTGGTSLLVWRDPQVHEAPYTCLSAAPTWQPLFTTDLVAFDEAENATDLCPNPGDCFPYATQRMAVSLLAPPSPFGFLYLNLNGDRINGPGPAFNGARQAWVSPVMDAAGRFSVGFRATALDSALTTSNSGVTLIP